MKHFLRLEEFCIDNNIEYSDNQDLQFKRFSDYLVEKNKVINLTSIIEPDDIEIKHFIDSIAPLPIIGDLLSKKINKNDITIIDIGTGAGFPGVPLAIMLPDLKFTLADSLDKRINFIKEIIGICELYNIFAVHARAEDLGRNALRESFDICVSRAVAAMPVLLEYCLPMVKPGGHVILYKSGSYAEELDSSKNALSILGGTVETVKTFTLPCSDIERSLIVIRKSGATPDKYPRKAGKPAKSPL